ncbi:hypothetical protein CANARDRAFT_185610, partial [[Candida] arabinofermentans NRRL YB-2248]
DLKMKSMPSSGSVAVVQEQANANNLVHLLPLNHSTTTPSNASIAPSTANFNTGITGDIIPSQSHSILQPTNNSVAQTTSSNEQLKIMATTDSLINHLKTKRSVIDGSISNSSDDATSIPLRNKKSSIINPSLSNLRSSSIQLPGNGSSNNSDININNTSHNSDKTSSRAEFFAAKLHDAIKDDENNKSDSDETFVYDTSAKQQDDDNIKDNTTEHNRKQSFDAQTKENDDGQDTQYDAQSRTSSKKFYNKLDSLAMAPHDSETAKISEDDPKNHLRQITSRVFDLKGVTPRRYSGLNFNEYDLDDNDNVDYLDEAEENFYNINKNGTNINGATPYSLAAMRDDDYSDFEDEHSLHENNKSRSYGNYGSINSNAQLQFMSSTSDNQQQPLLDSRNKLGGNKILRRKKNNLYFSPHDFTGARAARIKQIKSFFYTIALVFLFLSLGFVSGFLLATTKELQHTKISGISDILLSEEELVFNLAVESFNPGFLGIVIQDVEIDVFARSEYITDLYSRRWAPMQSSEAQSPISTVLLGTLDHLEVPFVFEGGFLSRQKDVSVTTIKIINPCSFDDSKKPDEDHKPIEKWLNISRNPFDLIVRGVLNYQLPISNSNRTIAINRSFKIDPDNLD